MVGAVYAVQCERHLLKNSLVQSVEVEIVAMQLLTIIPVVREHLVGDSFQHRSIAEGSTPLPQKQQGSLHPPKSFVGRRDQEHRAATPFTNSSSRRPREYSGRSRRC